MIDNWAGFFVRLRYLIRYLAPYHDHFDVLGPGLLYVVSFCLISSYWFLWGAVLLGYDYAISDVYVSAGAINEPAILLISVRDPGYFGFSSYGSLALCGSTSRGSKFLFLPSFPDYGTGFARSDASLFPTPPPQKKKNLAWASTRIVLMFCHGPISLVLTTS